MMTEQINSKPATHFKTGPTDGSDWKPGHPLSVGGCMIMLCEEGSLEITVNSRKFTMKDGSMAFVVFDMVAIPVKISDNFRAKFIELDFESAQNAFFIVTSNRFWEQVYTYPVFKLRRSLRDITSRWFSTLDWIKTNCSEITAQETLRREVENFMLVMAEKVESYLGSLDSNPPKNRAWAIINEFLGLVNHYYTNRHDVAFYADKLNITPNYLNIIAKKNLGITAKEQINLQLAIVVKMLLDTTDLTVKEIAERLHYNDPSYLCRIFRKQTGLSPLQFRNKLRTNPDLTTEPPV
ncbi:AraC family transcriptional regulator [uncultured Duncaniella sp.]|uniref:helix-turn-helix domain-containing protein n=1 Tax=uncultured Duncaniella sp. TaxID=2768039 RepID=UPI002648803B|nr:helix-turn-helix transcriptional regulator [uncultured Duncaniella sp.]